jgi:hypothetical protein
MIMLDNISEKETLPRGPEDDIIPTRIAKLDEHADFLESQMDALKKEIEMIDVERTMLLNRAKELGITEDFEYKIVQEPVYPKKHVDVEVFKSIAPERYNLVVAAIHARLKDKMDAEIAKANSFISQSDVKAVVREKGMLAQIIPEPKEPSGYKTIIVRK